MEIAGTTSSAARDQRQGPDKSAPPAARPMPTATSRRKLLRIVAILFCIVAIAGAGGWYWWQQQLHALPAWITQANGRLEAEQVEIATKYPGRVAVVLAKEGDMVDAGQVVARMDTAELEAQLHSAEAKVRQAEFEQAMVEAVIVQRDSERTWAKQELDRAATLNRQGWSTGEQLDQRRNQMRSAQATYDAALAALDAVKAQIIAGQAEVARIKSQISDSVLVAPIRGRIQYKLSQPGEVLPAGGRVFTLLDLSDIYMTIFVPAHAAGLLALGDEARVTLDPVPGFVFPAKVTFVATEAQFTPKMVETAEEREKLMFRVKLSIDESIRHRYEEQVKTGLRGIGFVRTDRNAPWPDRLGVKLP